MIKLDIEEYCHGCPCFSPEADDIGYYYENGRMKFAGNTNVICERKDQCSAIYDYLKDTLNERRK